MAPQVLQLLGALRRISQALDSRSKAIEHESGLTLPQLLLLEALRSEPEAPSAGRLAQLISLSQGTVTSILDRLEARGLVQRLRPPHDRRRVIVVFTEHGRAVLERAPPPMRADFIQGFAALDPADREALLCAVDRIADLMRTSDFPTPAQEVHATV